MKRNSRRVSNVKKTVFAEKDQMRLLMGSLIIAVWLMIGAMVVVFLASVWAFIS